MARNVIVALGVLVCLTSCSGLRPISSTISSPLKGSTGTPSNSNHQASQGSVKFLDDIAVESDASVVKKTANTSSTKKSSGAQAAGSTDANRYFNRGAVVEKATSLHFKYAVLLNTEVELLVDNTLLEHVDEWYGTPYRLGGNTKKGIDCSAFVQAVYTTAYAVTMPRTAREQYKHCRIVSATELQEGDLVFFNTRGGVSHVGIYLRNNKFIHASVSQGVTVSDLFDPYYMKRYIGAGRVAK